jgi:dopamine beta-monooxygenase
MTLGGFGTIDEMCVNYMHYYPVVELEVCKSSIRDDVLEEFFEKMKEFDLAETSSEQSIAENFNKIRWTYLTSSILNKLYDTAPLSFSCNKSDSGNLLMQNEKYMNEYTAFKLPLNDFGNSERFCNVLDNEYD